MAEVYRLNAEGKPVKVVEVEEAVDVAAEEQSLADAETAQTELVQKQTNLNAEVDAAAVALEAKRQSVAALKALPVSVPVQVAEETASVEEAPAEEAVPEQVQY